MMDQTTNKPNVCGSCGMECSSQEELMKHTSEAHGVAESDSKNVCTMCGAKFETSENLAEHAKSHKE